MKEILNLKEFCELVGISRRTAFRVMKSKKVKHYKQGNRFYFKREDVEAYLFSNPIGK